MYDFKIAAADKPTHVPRPASGARRPDAGEPDAIANMANVAALIWETLPDINWAGFYRNIDGELVLGPFQGRPACIRIPFGQGVCGAAAADPSGPARRGCSRFSGPHRLRCRIDQRAGRADRSRWQADCGARSRQPDARRGSPKKTKRAACGLRLLAKVPSSSAAPAARR